MFDFDSVDGRRVAVRAETATRPPSGRAKLVPAGAAGGLSSEMVALCYGPEENVGRYLDEMGLTLLEEERAAGGTCALYALPSAEIARTGLPAETRLAVLRIGSVIAHGYFYRPFNRMDDAVTYFTGLSLAPTRRGVAVPRDRFRVLDQAYTTTVDGVGLVSFSPPRGVPRAGRAARLSGALWVDRVPGRLHQVVFENRTARLSFRPLARRGVPDPDAITPEFERRVVGVTDGLATVSWS